MLSMPREVAGKNILVYGSSYCLCPNYAPAHYGFEPLWSLTKRISAEFYIHILRRTISYEVLKIRVNNELNVKRWHIALNVRSRCFKCESRSLYLSVSLLHFYH